MGRFASVDVYNADKLFEHLELSLEGEYIVLPDKPPYQGLKYYISYRGEYISFSPDGYEYFVKFGKDRTGQVIEYLDGKSYKIVFKEIEK